MTEYNAYYLEKDYFGPPSEDLIVFFENNTDRGTLLDVGCGQGRNAILLAQMGYEVTGIDISKVGVQQMVDAARRKNISVQGIVDDIYNFSYPNDYKFILLDSMIHFYKNDVEREKAMIENFAEILLPDGYLCFNMLSSEKNIKLLKETIASSSYDLKLIEEKYSDYVFQGIHSSPYCFLVFKNIATNARIINQRIITKISDQ
jgi:tellurite methyltransferase